MQLNPKKCILGVRSGKFLGYMISKDGVRVNPDKVKAIMYMAPSRNIKEVQRLAGRMAALNKFLSKSTVKGSLFFKTLRRGPQFEWTSKCQKAFDELKAYIAQLPALTSPAQGETLFIYLAVGEEAISTVLVWEEDKIQKPVYYVSRALQGAESRYTPVERYVLTLVHSVRKLRSYFQTHPVIVVTDQPLKQILSKPDVSGRMVKWAVELSKYDLDYQPRTAIKTQALVDFIAESVFFGLQEAQAELTRDTVKAEQVGEATEVTQVTKAAQTEQTRDTTKAEQAEEVAKVTQATKAGESEQIRDAAKGEQAGEATEDTQAIRAAEAKQTRGAAETRQAGESAEVGQAGEVARRVILTWTLFVDGASSKEGCGVGLLLTSPMGEELAYALKFDFRASNNESEYKILIAGMVIARKLGAESIKIFSDLQLIVNKVLGNYKVKEEPLKKYVAKVVRGRAYDQLDEAVIQVMGSWMDPIVRHLVSGELPSNKVEACRILIRSREYVLTNGVLYRKSYLRP
ncbi:uncharacterized protein [Coffea arabica]|uniref:Uncharacterized protein n=1 Tax=Coffea arabica TaxID=13443 RepID=A0ABM4WN07_COFAR